MAHGHIVRRVRKTAFTGRRRLRLPFGRLRLRLLRAHVIMDSVKGPASRDFDVLVVGAGPAGAATAYWLASRGRRVLAVERKRFPREKTCGDGLTPRAVRQLHDLGLADRLATFQRFDGLRAMGHGTTLE